VTPALRLTVAWMIGALALAVGWRWYTVRAAAQIPPTPTFVDDPRHAITRGLRDAFPQHMPREGERTLPVYRGDPLLELTDPGLRRFRPETRFFVTRVVNGNYGDDLLVSFKRGEDGADDIRLWIAGAYDEEARRFVSQFLDVEASTPADRQALRRTLADLVEVIRNGHALLFDGPSYGHDIARDEVDDDPLRWLAIDLALGANGRVDRIAISHELDHGVYDIAFAVSSK
jgi:hypothetical protein